MASGCLLGECPVCKGLVWEDDYEMTSTGILIHTGCQSNVLLKFIELPIERQIELMYGRPKISE